MKTRHLLPIIALFIFPGMLFAQSAEYLDINNIRSGYSPGASLFSTDSSTMNAYEVPKGSGVKSIFSSNFWLTGLGQGGNLVGVSPWYNYNWGYSYGPIALSYTPTYDSIYNKVYKVSRTEINNHVTNYSTSGYIVPAHIAQWPGNGNAANGEAAILAPFVDQNHNGIYEPSLGDYPDVPGDQAIFMMMNDSRPGVNYFPLMGVELHVTAYAFDAPIDSPLGNTTFIKVKVLNRSANLYHDVYFSNWVDNDLGCANNDRIGCDTSCDFFYVYNGTQFDGGGGGICPVGQIGYGYKKVAQATVFLNKKMSSFNYFNIFGGNTTSDPQTCAQYRNYQTAHWKDGTPFTYGGTGYGGTLATSYLFPGDPTDSSQWSELFPHLGYALPYGDRRSQGSVFLDSLPAGQSAEVDIAYVTSFADSVSPLLAEVGQLRNDACQIKHLFSQGGLLAGVNNLATVKTAIMIYPNPTKGLVNIEAPDRLTSISVMDIQGRELIRREAINETKLSLDLSHLSKGLYLINAVSPSGSCMRRIILD